VKKNSPKEFKPGDIFRFKGIKEGLKDDEGIAAVTHISGDHYVNARGLEGEYEGEENLSFDLEYYDLFLKEEVWIEDLPEVEVREPGVFRVGDIVEIKHDGESHWLGEIEVTGVKDGKIINAKNISASPWSPGTGLGFMTTAIHYGFKLKEV